MEEKNPIQVADRIFLVIETLASNGSCGLTELSSMLSLNKSTVHRILNSLIYMGYVRQDMNTAKYSLSFKIWEIANQVLGRIDIVDYARPHLKHLVTKTEETVHLVQIDGTNAIYIDKVEAYNNPVRLVSKIGKSIPLYCSGVGKALLADMDDTAIQKIWQTSRIKAYTENTITDFPVFMEKISIIRQKGYALDDEENELGVRCIATSLKDYKGSPKYAISISAPVSRMTDVRIEELAAFLLEAKQRIASEWA